MVGRTGGRTGGGGGVDTESDGNSDAVLPDEGAALRTEDEGGAEGVGALMVGAGAVTLAGVVAGVAGVAALARRGVRVALCVAAGVEEVVGFSAEICASAAELSSSRHAAAIAVRRRSCAPDAPHRGKVAGIVFALSRRPVVAILLAHHSSNFSEVATPWRRVWNGAGKRVPAFQSATSTASATLVVAQTE
jgi:hypothetical protein